MIEIEKKYELTDHDYQIIKNNCSFVVKKNVYDNFYDTNDFSLFQKKIKLRERNGEMQLKMKISDPIENYSKSLELLEKEEINNKLHEMWIEYENTKKVLEIYTEVEKYTYEYKWFVFILDIQKYKYNNRYEIELEFDEDNEIDAENIINDFRCFLGLTAQEQISTETKVITCAKHENPELYEVILQTKVGE